MGLLAVIAFMTVGAASSAAATLGVSATGANTGNCVDDPCLTVQYAVDQATDGDTIAVGPGTFTGQTLVNGKSLTIDGAGDTTILEAPAGTIPVLPGTTRRPILGAYGDADLTVTTLKLDGAETATASANVVGFGAMNASADIEDVTIVDVRMPYTDSGPPPQVASNQVGSGVYAFANAGDHSFRMDGSRVSAFQKNGISAGSQFLTVEITDNQVTCGGRQNAQQQNALVVGFGATGANPVKKATVTGNTVGACQYAGPSPNFQVGAGTLLWHNAAAADDVVFSGNTVNGSDLGLYAEASSPASEIEISGNDFLGAGSGNDDGAGLNLVGGTIEVTGNEIDGDGPFGKAPYGISLGGTTPTLTITGNAIKNTQVGIATANPVPSGVTASNNTFTGNGANANQRVPGVDVGTDLWVATDGTDGGGNSCLVEASPCATIQHAVDQAVAGDTINVADGTYGLANGNATVAVNKANLTISGNDTADTIVEAPEGPVGATAFEIGEAGDGLTIEDLTITSPEEGFATDLRGIRTAAGPVTVDGLTIAGVQISDLRYGFETPSVATAQQATITNIAMRNSYLHGNEYALWFGGDTDGLEITESVISGNDFGIQSYPPEPNPDFEPGVFDDVSITETTFTANAKKAIYLEAASDLAIDGVNVLETGSVDPVNPPAFKPPYDGIDINAKFGDFSNITITDSSSNGNVVNPVRPLAVQGGVSIKSRNDGPTYGAHPASITDVNIDGLTSSENENGLILGGDVDDIDVADSNFGGNDFAGISIVRETAGTPSTITNLSVDNSFLIDNVNGIATNTGADQSNLTGLSVTRNFIEENTAGIRIGAAGFTGTGVSVAGNVFGGNTTGIANESAGSLNAENNWWGCNSGPGTAGCDGTTGTVDGSPYLVFSAIAGANSVGAGGSTQVTAGFNRNSDGQAADGSVFAGPSVEFSAENGSVNPASVNLAAGEAVTTFTGSGTPGAGKVTAHLGDQVAEATIQVRGTAPAVSQPGLSGSGRVGQALTCTPGNVTGGNPAPSVETVLLANGSAIPGQSGLSYTPVESDVGKSITCRTTATNSVDSVSATSSGVTVSAVPVDPPKPPVVTPIKKTADVPKSGKVVVTTVKCPEGTCKVNAPKKIKVKIGGKTYTATVRVDKTVREGETAKVTIVLPKKARKAIKGKSGKAKLKITVTSSDGKKKTLNQTIKLKGKKR